jgi:hypothetical protein
LDENAGAAEPIQGRRHPQPRGIQKWVTTKNI